MAHSDPAHSDSGADRRPDRTSFIGSFLDEPDQAVIVLRGDIDAATVERLALHIEGVLDARARFVTVDAAAVDSYDPDLLDLLGRTQHRLGSHRGMVQVRGLHPSLLPPVTAAPRAGSVAGSRPGLRPVPEPAP